MINLYIKSAFEMLKGVKKGIKTSSYSIIHNVFVYVHMHIYG